MSGLEGVAQGVVVEKSAAGSVHENRALRHTRDLAPPDHAPRVRGESGVQADHPRTFEQLVQLDRRPTSLLDIRRVDERVVCEDPGAEGHEDSRHPATYRPETHEPHRSPVELNAALLVGRSE